MDIRQSIVGNVDLIDIQREIFVYVRTVIQRLQSQRQPCKSQDRVKSGTIYVVIFAGLLIVIEPWIHYFSVIYSARGADFNVMN